MTKRIIMQLDELTCPSCLTKIESALTKQAGVANVKVLFNAGKVKADFDGETTDPSALEDVVTQLGYPVVRTKVKELTEG